MKKLGVLLVVAALTGCGGSDGGDSSKSLFSVWYAQGSDVPVDFSMYSFGETAPLRAFFDGGGQCVCDITFIGEDYQGSISLNSCVEQANNQQGLNCNAMNGVTQYYNDGKELKLVEDGETTLLY